MAAHTPGTWAVVRPTNEFDHPTVCAFDGDPADGLLTAVVAEVISDADGDPPLIAAAPVLLSALRRCVRRIERPNLSPDASVVLEEARAAIAQAEPV